MKKTSGNAQNLLTQLRTKLVKLHGDYESLFWTSYMGDHSVDEKKDVALAKRDAFNASEKNLRAVIEAMKGASASDKKKLAIWKKFFELYQTPSQVKELKRKINELESRMVKNLATLKEGYIDPATKKFVKASRLKMGNMMHTNSSEEIRKACFVALEDLGLVNLDLYVTYVGLLNEYARIIGYDDFYAYKIELEEGMAKKELFKIFDELYEKTKYALDDIRKLEKKIPNLRKPWNFGYLMSGDFTKEEDPYFPFDQALVRWGRSFAALGVHHQGGELTLDLLDRKGKYANGFCHWPRLVHYKNGKRVAGRANFTCNVVYGDVGSAREGYETLFHEGGHAAHFLNSDQEEVCLNHEYPPMSTAWAETQSMFMDTILSSYEWKSRYAQTASGEQYPFDLFERKERKLHILNPMNLSGIMFVSNFEREIYETKDLTAERVKDIARSNYKKYFDRSEDSLRALKVPHIYSWTSACSYHGYGLAELAVAQWRDYFHDKFEYIVDNPKIVGEMRKVWKKGALNTFKEFVREATGKELSAKSWIKSSTQSIEAILKTARDRERRLAKVPVSKKPIDLGARITMVSEKEKIADNTKSFENMAEKYGKWLNSKRD